jgi:hypothetical protein
MFVSVQKKKNGFAIRYEFCARKSKEMVGLEKKSCGLVGPYPTWLFRPRRSKRIELFNLFNIANYC